MPYSLLMNTKQVIRKLKALGVEVMAGRGKGGHMVLVYRGRQTVIAVHSRDMPPHHVKTICNQLGIDPSLLYERRRFERKESLDAQRDPPRLPGDAHPR